MGISSKRRIDREFKFKKIIAILFGSLALTLSENILDLNSEIEQISFQYYDFDFSDNSNKVDELIERCSNIDYLIGESELLNLKIFHAVAIDDEDVVYELEDLYAQKL